MMEKLEIVNVYHDGESYRDMTTKKKVSKSRVSKRLNDLMKDNTQEIAETIVEVDGKMDYRMVNARNGESYSVINVKEDYEFTKVFKVDVRKLLEMPKLSPYAKAFMHDAMSYMNYPTNTLVYKSKTPSIEKLCELMDLKRAKMYQVLKELEEKDVIQRHKLDGKLTIFVNPYLYSCGLVCVNTCEMFKDSIYNPYNK